MRINKILFIMLFSFIAQIIISCCDCMEPLIGYYSTKTILVNNIDNTGAAPLITTATSLPKEAYGIRILLNQEKLACQNNSTSFFISSANATKCVCLPSYQLLPKDSLTTIQIFTINNFDNNHPANSDITTYFKVFQIDSFSTITEFLKHQEIGIYSDQELGLNFDILLMTVPSFKQNHSFKVKITLSDGRILEAITPSIDLL